IVSMVVWVFGFVILQLSWLKIPSLIVRVGLISYPLYVVHQNIGIIIIRELAPLVHPIAARIAIAIGFVLVLAQDLHNMVETRWQKSLAEWLGCQLRHLSELLPIPRRKPTDLATLPT